ncbi:MAG: UDP-N-acetylglucosamine 1-carboxyvinyltransferase [Elusimicrobia bacterium]|nr:UDP-N-acetylglucosamine 1-carboxyvinyltransferase [Elusimicrobiota bacterium]
MDAYLIEGGHSLRGRVEISGSKNAALPCLFASLLTQDPLFLYRVPGVRDIKVAAKLLERLGKTVKFGEGKLEIREGEVSKEAQREIVAPYDLIKQMRASVLAAGPMLARWGKARVSMPGGCAIGLRPIDIHLDGLRAMGASVEMAGGDMVLTAPAKGLHAIRYRLKFPSVGATENLMLAAALLRGTTVLERAAREPEIEDLAELLKKMGAGVQGAGTSRIKIKGAKRLNGAGHTIIPDRIETGTFILLAAIVPGSSVQIASCQPAHNAAVIKLCRQAGVDAQAGDGVISVKTGSQFRPKPVSIKTAVYPGFATDLQPLWMAFMARSKGKAKIQETIFENRFLHAAEMNRLGAKISVKGDTALIEGIPTLVGAPVMAGDLRAGAGLIAAALTAKGMSKISRIYHVDRGYENLEMKLTALGAKIERFEEVRYKRVS